MIHHKNYPVSTGYYAISEKWATENQKSTYFQHINKTVLYK